MYYLQYFIYYSNNMVFMSSALILCGRHEQSDIILKFAL